MNVEFSLYSTLEFGIRKYQNLERVFSRGPDNCGQKWSVGKQDLLFSTKEKGEW